MVGGGSARRHGETHEGTIRSAVGTETQMRAACRKARSATKEENANQQGQSEENPDNVFHRDTFHQRSEPRLSDAKLKEVCH